MNQPTEADVKKAHEEGCTDVKRVIRTLFPDAFKRERFKPGDRVSTSPGSQEVLTVIGYASDPAALAFFKSRGGNSTFQTVPLEKALLAFTPERYAWINDDGFWTLHKA